ncbi:hypothetical protein [Cupriavidus pauculus]|uniref:hypothetical protein n=1 Tax=Cupriavidus pauculus TaxID=82633 RepID=UPI00207F352C|nr:hypothetical protein CBA19C6_13150 [Cupriavidus pauculus]
MQRTTAGKRYPAARKRLTQLLMSTMLAMPLALSAAPPASGDTTRDKLRDAGCQTLAQRVAAIPGTGPVMLASYEGAPGGEPLPGPLKESAFVYDNALAGIALIACGQNDAARRIADGVVAGVTRDRHFHDGRIRNAYRAGAMPAAGAVPMPGWWDAKANRWFEDRYQVGTATGNVAWAALLLLAAYDTTRAPRYLDTARTMMGWVDKETYNADAPAAFIGGFFGHEPTPQRQGWKSTEHNVDTYAVFRWLSRYDADPRWRTGADRSRKFVETMWQPGEGRFAIGTRDDGRTLNGGPSALDASLWPLIAIPDMAGTWQCALTWARDKHGVKGGYGFNANPDGIWTEGTGQAALVLRAAGRDGEAAPLWPLLMAQRAPSGLLFATPDARVRTGLQIGPDSKTDDFYYFHLPHLGATAWAVLAATGWNPFQPGGCRGTSCGASATAPPATPPKE